MILSSIGVNHRSAPVAVRERLSVGPGRMTELLCELRDFTDEAVLVSTCNRVEVYLCAESESIRDTIRGFFAKQSGLEADDVERMLYIFRGKDAVHHLFKVASGIDSMVRGETQILAQVKDAYVRSFAEGMTGPVLNPLFQAAFRTAKLVHTESEIGRRKVSVGSVVADLAEKILGGLEDKQVLMVGAGKVAELTLRHLAGKGARSVLVANRTYERALALAERFGGVAMGYDTLDDNLVRADVVVTSSAAPHFLLRLDRVRRVMGRRHKRPLIIIDVAVPRDVDPEVRVLENVHLHDIDDLQGVVEDNLAMREGEVESCLEIVEQAANEYWTEARHSKAARLIKGLTDRLHDIRREELERSRAKLSCTSEEHVREVERLTERLVNRILHEPLKAIRAEASKNKDPRESSLLEALYRLFNMPFSGGDPPVEKD